MKTRVTGIAVLSSVLLFAASLSFSPGALSAPAKPKTAKKAVKAAEPKVYQVPADWGSWKSDAGVVPSCSDRTLKVTRPDGKVFNAFVAYKCAPNTRTMWLTDAETGAVVFQKVIGNEDSEGALRLETHDVDSDGTADVVFVHGEVADTWGTTVVDALLIAQGKFAAYEWQASDDGGVSEEFLGEAESKKNAKLRKGLKNAMSKFPWE